MASVESIEHTADIGVRISAGSAGEAFTLAAGVMFDFMVDRSAMGQPDTWQIHVEGTDWEDLLVRWLEELLHGFEIEGRIPGTIEIRGLVPTQLHAEIRGDRLDLDRDERGVQIKAVTYHQLRSKPTSDGFEVQVIFDI